MFFLAGLLPSNGYLESNSDFSLRLSLIVLSIETTKALRALHMADDLGSARETMQVVFGPASDVGVEVPSIVSADRTKRLKPELKK